MKRIYLGAFIALILLSGKAFGQQEMSMYHVGKHVFQGSFLNPAFTTEKDNFAIFSPYINLVHDGFKVNDVLMEREQDDSLELALDTMVARLNDRNFLAIQTNVDLIGFKFRHRKNHFSFSTGVRNNIAYTYTRDFMEFLLLGNGQSMGRSMDLGIDFKTMQYLQVALGYAREIKRFQVGGRVKVLGGLSTFSTSRSDAFYHTNDTTLALSVGADYLINTAGLNNARTAFGIDDGIMTPDALFAYLLNTKNLGLAFDFGATYRLTKRIELSASILDIGSIRWKDDVVNYQSTGQYTFSGLDLFKFATQDGVEATTEADLLQDTLLKTFEVAEDSVEFTTNLMPRHYLGANVNLPDSVNLSVLVYGDLFHGYRPSFSVGLSKQFGNWLNFGLNYSIKHRSYENVGASLILSPGPFQMFFMADNLYSLVDAYGATNINFRMGINARFRFVRPKLRPKDF